MKLQISKSAIKRPSPGNPADRARSPMPMPIATSAHFFQVWKPTAARNTGGLLSRFRHCLQFCAFAGEMFPQGVAIPKPYVDSGVMGVILIRYMACVLLLVSCTCALAQRNLSASPAAAFEQRMALVIGNSAYKEAPLRNPVNDAADMAAVLRALGFDVTLMIDGNTRQMRAAIRQFAQSLKKGGVGLFYFAGHGVQSKSGKNYLIPIGSDLKEEFELEDETVDANRVLAGMEEAGNRVNIMILDACRNNPFARSWRSATNGLAQMNAPAGSFIGFATAPGQVAADGSGRNGIYTKHLLANLREGDSDIDRVFTRVAAAVSRETDNKQVPWRSSSLTGSFAFRTLALAAQSPPATLPEALSVPSAANSTPNTGASEVRLETVKREAQSGTAAAQYELGMMYYKGEGTAQNLPIAAGWLQKAAEQGNARAQALLGKMYRDGEGVTRDYVKAVDWLKRAANQGIVQAQAYLGVMYVRGDGVPQDNRTGFEWCRKAADQGNAFGQYCLGSAYRHGLGVPKDTVKALDLYLKAVAQGDANASTALFVMYENGDGVPKNVETAIGWLRKAADLGDSWAQYTLALSYEKGDGVPRDLSVAVEWYKKSAAQGDEDAQERLGSMYAVGEGVPRDLVLAYAWFNLAASGEFETLAHKSALQGRRTTARSLSPAQINEAERLSSRWKKGVVLAR